MEDDNVHFLHDDVFHVYDSDSIHHNGSDNDCGSHDDDVFFFDERLRRLVDLGSTILTTGTGVLSFLIHWIDLSLAFLVHPCSRRKVLKYLLAAVTDFLKSSVFEWK